MSEKRMGWTITALICAATLSACNEPAPSVPPSARPSAAPTPYSASPPDTSIPPPSTAPVSPGATARGKDTSANSPTEALTKEKEVNSMPLAGQANGHSSPSLDASGKR